MSVDTNTLKRYRFELRTTSIMPFKQAKRYINGFGAYITQKSQDRTGGSDFIFERLCDDEILNKIKQAFSNDKYYIFLKVKEI